MFGRWVLNGWDLGCRALGFRVFDLRVYNVRVLGLRVLCFRVLGFRDFGFRVRGFVCPRTNQAADEPSPSLSDLAGWICGKAPSVQTATDLAMRSRPCCFPS